MKLIVGLGNPGSQYYFTRHNIGFLLIDLLAETYNLSLKKDKKALIAKANINGEQIVLCKPQTFMNLSGEATLPLLSFYKINPEDMLVIHDDIDHAFGSIRLQKNRGHGGHNGIRDIINKTGNKNFARLKLGVGRPSNPHMEVSDYVLQNFNKEEENKIADFLSVAGEATESFVLDGFEKAATKFNGNAIQ